MASHHTISAIRIINKLDVQIRAIKHPKALNSSINNQKHKRKKAISNTFIPRKPLLTNILINITKIQMQINNPENLPQQISNAHIHIAIPQCTHHKTGQN
jgi:hypothetical protein